MGFFKVYYPSAELQDMVELYWRSKITLQESLILEMYTPIFQCISFNLNGNAEKIIKENYATVMNKPIYIIGQSLTPRISIINSPGIDVLGVKFTALGLHLLTKLNMKYISNNVIDAEYIWKDEILSLKDKIHSESNIENQIKVLETFLLNERKTQAIDSKYKPIVKILRDIEEHKIYSLTQLRDNNYISKKTLERYFLEYIGITPKQYKYFPFQQCSLSCSTRKISPRLVRCCSPFWLL